MDEITKKRNVDRKRKRPVLGEGNDLYQSKIFITNLVVLAMLQRS